MSPLLDRDAVIRQFSSPPSRVISLVPSITESLFDLGLGSSLVGITDYCIHPASQVAALPRVGGTKTPQIARILELKPDLVLANQEENTLEDIQQLENEGIYVWLNFPKTVNESMEMLWAIVAIYHSRTAALRLDTLQRAVDWAAASASEIPPWRFFCPVWQSPGKDTPQAPRWWMTFNDQTYMADLLRLFGGVNAFARRERRYPLEADLGQGQAEDANGRDTRYPRITASEIEASAPDVILLPTEPYPYQSPDAQTIADLFPSTPAARNERILVVDGSQLTWHGTRLGKALREFPALLSAI